MAVNKHPDGRRWIADFSVRINGKRKRFQETFDSKKTAEDWEINEPKRILAQLKAVEKQKAETTKKDLGERTIDEMIQHFVSTRRFQNLAPKSQQAYKSRLRIFSEWCAARGIQSPKTFMPEGEHRYSNAEQYYEYLLAKYTGEGPEAKLQAVVALFNHDLKRPYAALTSSPWVTISRARVERGEVRWFTKKELAAIRKVASEWELHVFDLKLATGMRSGEMRSLTNPQIVDGVIKIVPHDGWIPKWGKSRNIPLNARAKECIEYFRREYPNAHSVILGEGGKPIGHNVLLRHFGWIVGRVKLLDPTIDLSDTSPHTFRATCGSLMLQQRVPIAFVSSFLGHQDIRTTMRHYASLCVENLQEAADSLNFVFEIQSGDLSGD